MAERTSKFEIPRHIERYLAALSKLYAQEGKRQLQEIIVNAQTRVHEEFSYDNWNGGTYGHAIYLVIPEAIFLSSVNSKDNIEKQITQDLNRIHNVQNEFIETVFLEMEALSDPEWRKASGLLATGQRVVTVDAAKRIWGDEGFRVFLSHKSEVKKETTELKKQLRLYGISSFVAHVDIRPTKEWQDEIENALASMDGFVALMTDKFHDSEWTDQEVGFAIARGIPIIAIRLGMDPYGFIGKFQAITSPWEKAHEQIAKTLIRHDRMFSAYVQALRKCERWEDGNIIAGALDGIERLTTEQINDLVSTYNECDHLRGSWGFNGEKSQWYGPGLVWHLNRLGSRRFKFSRAGQIETV
jgi:hypothetical protein